MLAVLLLGLRTGGLPAADLDFQRDIRPILFDRCAVCHGPDEAERQADLRLDTFEGATADLGGYAAIVPGDIERSELLLRVTSPDPDAVMPPAETGKRLSEEEIGKLRSWIQSGAEYSRHWSLVKPVRPELPAPARADWPRNGVDHFILDRLEREGLAPSPELERGALARRVSLDLTGLPPRWEEVEAFRSDTGPDAYERFVDRLLMQPAFGEHWARSWLDLARYADSAGYADDPERTIWLYRDYVIRAFNDNRPFDEFPIEQIAGDLLPNPTPDQIIATAFHRNTMTNNEGGTDDEEFRNVAVVDRVNTTFTVWMATTMACAQCHTHKFDPLTQAEYFGVFAILNNTRDADRRDEAPVFSQFTAEQLLRRRSVSQNLDAAREALQRPTEARLAEWDQWPKLFPERLTWQTLRSLQKELDGIRPVTVPVMEELPLDQQRETRIHIRGNFRNPGESVGPGLPSVFPPPHGAEPIDRLRLAQWLMDAENPLTARVLANRLWEQIFGMGLVATSDDFGVQGDLPSHPELLDWLALELVESNWDVKRFLKLLTTSATYRQTSRVTPALLEADPENRLLARGPRFRLSAEMVRDQMLFVSGLLSPKMYGPPVKPLQPASGLTAAFGGGIDWVTSAGEDGRRRAIYTSWRRSNPYPSMVTFDAPSREVCVVRRGRTNTPLQALATLNDPVAVEAAQALARRALRDGGNTPAERARFLLQSCLSRDPLPEEVDRLTQLSAAARAQFQEQPEQAWRMAVDPLGPLPEGLDVIEAASWTVVANVVLNLDEMMMKR